MLLREGCPPPRVSTSPQKGAIIGCCATGKGAGVNVGRASRKVMFPLVFTNIDV